MREAGQQRKEAVKQAHRARIAELLLKGKTVRQIAAEIGISHPTVVRDIKVLSSEWREAARADIDEIKARELAKLDMMEAEAWSAYQRSTQDYTRKIVGDKPVGRTGAGGRSASVETGSQHGDPRFLRIILDCQERRAKILGADAPQKIAQTNPDGSALSKEHRDAIVAAAVAAAAANG